MENTTQIAVKPSAFEVAATKERKTIDALLNTVIATEVEHSSTKGCDRWDSKFTISEKKYICEVKCRTVKHNAYPDTLIEQSKVKALIKLGEAEGRVPLLVISFTDNIAYVFKLTDAAIQSIKAIEMYCNKTTAVSSGKVEKKVLLLPYKLGKKVNLTQYVAPTQQSDNE